DRRPLVPEHRRLQPGPGDLPGLRRRRRGRLRGAGAAAGLPGRAGGGHPLARPLPALAQPRQRVRHRGFLRGRSAPRLGRRLRGVRAPGAEAGDQGGHRPGGQPHLGQAPLVPGSAARPGVPLPRLVRVVEKEALGLGRGNGVSGSAEVHLDAGSGGGGVLLPPLLPAPARPQRAEPGGARRDPPHHGLLAGAGGGWVPGGRGALHPGERRPRPRPPHAQLRLPVRDAPLRPVAAGRLGAAGGGQRGAPGAPQVLWRGGRRAADDVQLLGQPAPFPGPGHRRHPPPGRFAARHPPPAPRVPVGALPPQPRRAGPGPPYRRAARGRLREVRPGGGDAALRARHPPAAGAHAGRSAARGAGQQPDVLPPGHPRDPLRRRDRDGRRPAPPGARGRAHPHAVVGRGAGRLLHRRQDGAPGAGRGPARLPARQRRRPAARPRLAAALAHAHDPPAQAVPRDRLGRLDAAAHRHPRGARAALRLARRLRRRPPQLRRPRPRAPPAPRRRSPHRPHRRGILPRRRVRHPQDLAGWLRVSLVPRGRPQRRDSAHQDV
ncbi:MAG: GH13_16 / GH13_36 / GH13 / GH13_31 / GH13_ 17 / GH13_23 / GH13_40 / GH13_29 / GH13_4 / GH13 _35 / GH13_30 / GH13_20 / GH13_34 / GH13_2 / GH1 3_1 / GH13_21 / GH13_19 / GH13_26, partial [uncultured Gemmatimonadetes bacterium]